MASINDPIFYASHTYFDRLAHFLALSPELERRGFNRTWSTGNSSSRRRLLGHGVRTGRRLGDEEREDDDEASIHHHPKRAGCIGDDYGDPSPFSRFYFQGAHEDQEGNGGRGVYYTMREVDAMLDPRHPGLPYVYDDLMIWGGRRWVPKGKAREDEEDGEE